jgi:hypothetical protein
MNSKTAKTLKAIFQDPVQSNIPWTDIESVFVALGENYFRVQGLGCGLN